MHSAARHRHIETSTDTLVPEADVEERLRGRSSTLVARDAAVTPTVKRRDDCCDGDDVTSAAKEPAARPDLPDKCAAAANGPERRCRPEARCPAAAAGAASLAKPLLDLAAGGSRLARPWEVPAAAQERADTYFKNRIDTDGLPVHQTEVQRRLVAIYFTHQEQVSRKRQFLFSRPDWENFRIHIGRLFTLGIVLKLQKVS
jgi:hypothetical protein